MKVVDALVKTKLCKSKSAARRLIEQGGARVNDEKITDVNADLFFHDGHWLLVESGKPVKVINASKRRQPIEAVPVARSGRPSGGNDAENQKETGKASSNTASKQTKNSQGKD